MWFHGLRFNSDEIQNTPLATDNLVNILMYKSPFCVITHSSYKVLKMSSFWPNLYMRCRYEFLFADSSGQPGPKHLVDIMDLIT